MATYLKGVEPFVPDYQPFQPDFNFYANALQTKQNQYDQNWKQLNDVYSKYFHADVLRPEDQEKKDHLIKNIDFELRRVSGLDLSLEQNLQQATQVFKPFYEDKVLMHDIAYTKNYKNKRAGAMSLKGNADEKKADQYWETGIEYMDILKDQYAESNAEESMSMWSPEYTPYINAREYYDNLAEEMGIEMDITKPMGQWMVRQRNGDLVYQPLVNIFKADYANNPGLQEVYRVEAYVNGEKTIRQNMEGGMDRNAATNTYVQSQNKTIQAYLKEVSASANQNKIQKTKELDDVNEQIKRGNSNVYTAKYQTELEKSKAYAESVWGHVLKVKKETDDKGSSTKVTSQGDVSSDVKTLRRKVDAGTAMMLANQDIYDAAWSRSRVDMLVDYEANPFAVVQARHNAKLAEIAEKNRLDKQSTLDAARLASNLYIQDLETGDLYKNPLYTTQKKISNAVLSTDRVTNIIADNEEATKDYYNSEAKPGIIAIGEYYAKMAAKGKLPLSALFRPDPNMTEEEATNISYDIPQGVKKLLDEGNINVPLSSKQIAAYYKVNPFGLKNKSSLTEDQVREYFESQDVTSLYYDPEYMISLHDQAVELGINTRGLELSQNFLGEIDKTGISDYITLAKTKNKVDETNRKTLIKTLMSSTAFNALDILKNPQLKKSIVESFIQKMDANDMVAANSKISKGDFTSVNAALIKEAIENNLVPESVITIFGQSLKVKADRKRMVRYGYDLEGKKQIGNLSSEDLANVDKIYQKEYLKRLKDKGITYDPASGLLTKFRVGKKGSKQSMGSDAAFVNSGKSEDAWAYRLYRAETGNIRDEISAEYAKQVNKLVDFNENPSVALGTIYDNLSKLYAEGAQNTRELISFSPQIHNKGNAYGVDGVYGIPVPLAAAGAEGTNLFVDASLKLQKLDFQSYDAHGKGYQVNMGGNLSESDKMPAGINKTEAGRAMLILQKLQGLVGVSAKGNTEKPKGMDINIGAAPMGVFGDPNLGSISITGIDYEWLMSFTQRGADKTSSGNTAQIGLLSEDEAVRIAENGLHFIAPAEALQNIDTFKNVELDPLERVMIAEGQLPTYYDAYNSGMYTIKENIAEGQPHVIQGMVQYLNEDGSWSSQAITDLPTSQYNVSNMNKEMKNFMLEQRLINEAVAKQLRDKGINVSPPPELKPRD